MYSGLAGTLVRWLLPVVLAVAVSGMHHLPARAGGVTHHPAPGSHALVSASPAPDPGRAREEPARSCCPAPPAALAPAPRDDPPADHGTGHDLLHLCLAVLVAALASALIFAALRWYLFAREPMRSAALRPRAVARPPPVPISQRLAVLGVLRL
ncbi:hypothetical protein ABZ413_00815 [Nocardia rhamnosiphila]|uniref:Uncharacterized protein n=1 Tax=Nocardia rhamnosiphila TaxID=426716 RepID=A0ABV2WQ60_9NOCA|nr:hypothetical protein [Nocardia rhamnosiphila]